MRRPQPVVSTDNSCRRTCQSCLPSSCNRSVVATAQVILLRTFCGTEVWEELVTGVVRRGCGSARSAGIPSLGVLGRAFVTAPLFRSNLAMRARDRSCPVIVARRDDARRGDARRDTVTRRVVPCVANQRMLVIAGRAVTPLCLTTLRTPLTGRFVIGMYVLPSNRRCGGRADVGRVCSTLVTRRFGQSIALVTLNNNIVNSVAKFTTTDFVHNIGFVRVPAALLSRISSDINNGANVGRTRNGGVVKTF